MLNAGMHTSDQNIDPRATAPAPPIEATKAVFEVVFLGRDVA